MAKSVFSASIIVSAMTFISRILGLVRDAVVANFVGASAAADVFLLANRIPNFLRRLFAEGAFAQAFVPVLSEVKEKHGDDAVRLFVAQAAGTLGTILLIVTIIGVIGSPVVAALFATGWFLEWYQGGDSAMANQYQLASLMLKFTFPYLFFVSLVALSGAVLNAYNRFAAAAFTPVLLNIAIIGAAIYLQSWFSEPAVALALGVFIGGAVQLLFQLPFLWQQKMLVKPRFDWHNPHIKKVRTLMIPALFGVSVSQINLLLDTVIASFLMKGSIAWLYYADRLIEFPLGLFGIGIATVILPALSKLHNQSDTGQFQHTLDWGIRFVCLLGIPALAGLVMIAPLIINVLFGHGAFNEGEHDNTLMVSMAVNAYAVGLVSFMVIKVLAPGYYARQDTKTPVKIGIIAMVSNMAFNLLLAPFYGFVGLALATSLSASLNAYLLYRGLKKQGVYTLSGFSFGFISKCVVAALVMSIVLWLSESYLSELLNHLWQNQSALLNNLVLLTSQLVIAMVTYFGVLLALGVRLSTIKNVLHTESR